MPVVVLSRTADPAKPSPEQQLRLEWAANLTDEIKAKRLTPKAFHIALNEVGAKVTPQAVYSWLSGASSPSPFNQAYIAHVLKAPAHRLFPLPEVSEL